MQTKEIITPYIEEAYGRSEFSERLINLLVNKIDNFKSRYNGHTRQKMILDTCWLFYAGGTTADSVARKINDALPKP